MTTILFLDWGSNTAIGAPLLLDHVQKQNRRIEEQQKTIDALTQRLAALEERAVRSQW